MDLAVLVGVGVRREQGRSKEGVHPHGVTQGISPPEVGSCMQVLVQTAPSTPGESPLTLSPLAEPSL